MKHCVNLTIQVLTIFGLSEAAGAQSALDDAGKLNAAQQYDPAIAILDRHLLADPTSADGHLLLARSHHGKKDFEKAKASYQEAARLNSKYGYAIVPLLDELGEWNEIIRIVSPAVRKNRQLSPALLGPLASAYRSTGNSLDAERIMKVLTATHYKDQNGKDYKNYVLAYYYLWNDDTEKSKDRLKKIKSKAYLKYARSHDKFKKLHDDAEFQLLTE